ncbi:MAG: hypothetical protein EBZ68_06495 [Actinobacteria bacterium]|nr:hypothetical protein [Actinomycetota bacterium]NDE67355.1 hypothetical protein [Actinomycetota bacterium]
MDRDFVPVFDEPLDRLLGLLAVARSRPRGVGVPECSDAVRGSNTDSSNSCATPSCKSRIAVGSGKSIGTPLTKILIHLFLLSRYTNLSR